LPAFAPNASFLPVGAQAGTKPSKPRHLDGERAENDCASLAPGRDVKHGGRFVRLLHDAAAFVGGYQPSRTNSRCSESDRGGKTANTGDRPRAGESGSRACRSGDRLSLFCGGVMTHRTPAPWSRFRRRRARQLFQTKTKGRTTLGPSQQRDVPDVLKNVGRSAQPSRSS